MNSFLLPCRKHMCSALVGLISFNVMAQDQGFEKETGNRRNRWDLLRCRSSRLLSAHKITSNYSNLHLWGISLSSQPPLASFSSDSPSSPFLPRWIHCRCCFSWVEVVLSSHRSFSCRASLWPTRRHSNIPPAFPCQPPQPNPSVSCLCCPVPEFPLSTDTGSHMR